MSQYPEPQQFPTQPGFNYYAPASAIDPWAQYRRPAQHAAIFMFVLGALMLTCGVCFIGAGAALPYADLSGQDMSQLQELEGQLPFSLAVLFVVIGVLGLIPGLAILVLGFFVRKAYKIPIILSIILAGFLVVCILGHGASLALAGVSRGTGGMAGVLPGACMNIVALAAMGVLIAFLVRALKSAGQLTQAQAQYSQQYYQAYYAWQQQQAQAQQSDPPQQIQPPPSNP